jgi:predicted alpha/beta-fold hydrolase
MPKMILLVITGCFLSSTADPVQIAANEALPRNEVKQTPYGVLCTTSLGGHLSWFELGGGRWFAKAVSDRNYRVEIDLTFAL